MSEHASLVEEIDALLVRKASLAREAMLAAPTDPAFAELYDEWWKRADNELDGLLTRLYEIET